MNLKRQKAYKYSKIVGSLMLGILFFSTSSFAGFSGSQEIASTGGNSTLGIYYVQAATAPNPPGGLAAPLRFYVEVPPNAGAFEVRIFDPNVTNAGTSSWDFQVGTSFDTPITYSVNDPSGTLIGNLALAAGSNACAGCADMSGANCSCEGGWWSLAIDSTPMPGHYEIVIDSPTGDDVNRFAIWTLDPVNGVELNTYAESFMSLASSGGATYRGHPYVTEGCSVALNNFDMDDVASDSANLAVTSRSGSTIAINSLSGNSVWLNTNVNFTTINDIDDYGIWTNAYSFVGNLNPAEVYASSTKVSSSSAPTAQPSPDGARWYLQTVASTAPVKPYAAQFVRDSTGPNPPVVGQTTTAVVTLKLVNPTVYPITFSSPTNLFSAVIPGAEVLYLGESAVSQGSIVSEPSVGSGGTFSWNPGVVAAGATVLASYKIAITPTAVVSSIAVSSDTVIRYLDETQASNPVALARATQVLGPLCPLALSMSALTYALVHEVSISEDQNSDAFITWKSSGELFTKAYELFYYDIFTERWQGMSDAPLAAMNDSGLGGEYTFLLANSFMAELHRQGSLDFKIVEIDKLGVRNTVWESVLSVDDINYNSQSITDLKPELNSEISTGFSKRSISKQMQAKQEKDITHSSNRVQNIFSNVAFDYAATQSLYVNVAKKAFVEISAEDLAAQFTLSLADVRERLENSNFHISHHGQEVMWQKTKRGLLFYAFAEQTAVHPSQAYLLKLAAGRTMDQQDFKKFYSPDAHKSQTSFVQQKLHFEENIFAGTAISPDPRSDFWYWKVLGNLTGLEKEQHFEFVAADIYRNEQQAKLTLDLQGASKLTAEKEHEVEAFVNQVSVGNIVFSDFEQDRTEIVFASNLLKDGNNTLTLRVRGESQSILYINSFKIEYPHHLTINKDAPELVDVDSGKVFILKAAAVKTRNRQLLVNNQREAIDHKIRGFYDLQQQKAPAVLQALESETGYSLFLGGSSQSEHRVHALYDSNVVRDYHFSHFSERNLRDHSQKSDLLVLVPRKWMSELQPLVAQRTEQGLLVTVVSLEDIYHQYSYGEADAMAIQSFLKETLSWTKAPAYILLVGAGSFDYRDVQETGQNILPVLMKKTPHGLLGNDQLFLETQNTKEQKQSIGRFNANTVFELRAMIEKTLSYENAAADSWRQNALVVADQAESFQLLSSQIAEQLAYTFKVTEQIEQKTSDADFRSAILGNLNQGQGLFMYSGHGGFDRLSDRGLLRSEDIPLLNQNDGSLKPFIMGAFSCSIARFAFPGFDSFGAALVKKKHGAVAVWSPSGLSEFGDNQIISQLFTLKFSTEMRLGDAISASLAQFEQRNSNSSPVDALYVSTMQLLGDPSLVIRSSKISTAPNNADSVYFDEMTEKTSTEGMNLVVDIASKNPVLEVELQALKEEEKVSDKMFNCQTSNSSAQFILMSLLCLGLSLFRRKRIFFL